MVARLDAASQVKEGEPAQLWVDTRPMHIFDPQTGANLTRQEVSAGAGAPS